MQISLFATVIGAVGMVMASAFTAWASSSASTADVRTEVRVVGEREANHYLELQKQMMSFDKKLDILIGNKITKVP